MLYKDTIKVGITSPANPSRDITVSVFLKPKDVVISYPDVQYDDKDKTVYTVLNQQISDLPYADRIKSIRFTASVINDDLIIYLDGKEIGRNTQCLGNIDKTINLDSFTQNSIITAKLSNFGWICPSVGFGVKNLKFYIQYKNSSEN